MSTHTSWLTPYATHFSGIVHKQAAWPTHFLPCAMQCIHDYCASAAPPSHHKPCQGSSPVQLLAASTTKQPASLQKCYYCWQARLKTQTLKWQVRPQHSRSLLSGAGLVAQMGMLCCGNASTQADSSVLGQQAPNTSFLNTPALNRTEHSVQQSTGRSTLLQHLVC
jgi:hypothetical protein